jgi:hypothetical protein
MKRGEGGDIFFALLSAAELSRGYGISNDMKNKNSDNRISTALFLLIVGIAVFSTAAWWPPDFIKNLIAPPLETGTPAPQFELESLAGGKFALVDFAGKPVLLKFWSKG